MKYLSCGHIKDGVIDMPTLSDSEEPSSKPERSSSDDTDPSGVSLPSEGKPTSEDDTHSDDEDLPNIEGDTMTDATEPLDDGDFPTSIDDTTTDATEPLEDTPTTSSHPKEATDSSPSDHREGKQPTPTDIKDAVYWREKFIAERETRRHADRAWVNEVTSRLRSQPAPPFPPPDWEGKDLPPATGNDVAYWKEKFLAEQETRRQADRAWVNEVTSRLRSQFSPPLPPC